MHHHIHWNMKHVPLWKLTCMWDEIYFSFLCRRSIKSILMVSLDTHDHAEIYHKYTSVNNKYLFQLVVARHQTPDRHPVVCGDSHFSDLGKARIDWQDRLTVETGTSMFHLLSLTQLGETGLVPALCRVESTHFTAPAPVKHNIQGWLPIYEDAALRTSQYWSTVAVYNYSARTLIGRPIVVKCSKRRYCMCNMCVCTRIASTANGKIWVNIQS